MKKTLLLNRLVGTDKQTLGRASLYEGFKTLFNFATLEPAWFHNKVQISCIPAGRYRGKIRTSDKYGRHIEVVDVEGRALILIHWGNFYKDTEGCILVGEKFKRINADKYMDITSSKRTFNKLMKLVKNEEIIITITETVMYK